MKHLKKIGIALLVILLLAQFVQPTENKGEATSLTSFIEETKPNNEVLTMLKTACFDCHSNITRYPWYSNITPVNFWMAHHVEEGKEHLNFSEWSSYSVKKKEHKMEEVWEEVAEQEMPLDSYTWTHTDARLTETQVKQLVEWAKTVQSNYKEQLAN